MGADLLRARQRRLTQAQTAKSAGASRHLKMAERRLSGRNTIVLLVSGSFLQVSCPATSCRTGMLVVSDRLEQTVLVIRPPTARHSPLGQLRYD